MTTFGENIRPGQCQPYMQHAPALGVMPVTASAEEGWLSSAELGRSAARLGFEP